MKKPPLHPACAEWPKMSEPELEDLARDIKDKGQLEDIVLDADGQILDGSNRWDACERAGTDPITITYAGDDPIGFVISKNKHRRHLDKSQLAMIGARLMNLQRGSNRYEKKVDASLGSIYSKKTVADQLGLSRAAIDSARAVIKHTSPNVVAMVEKGEVSVRTANEALRAESSKDVQAKWTSEDVKRIGNEHAHKRIERKESHPKQPGTIPSIPNHIRIREYPENKVETHNGESQVRECSTKGFYLVNLYLIKKEITFLNRALNQESSDTEYEMSAKCLIKSLRERNYQLTNLNYIH